LGEFAAANDLTSARVPDASLAAGHALLWHKKDAAAPLPLLLEPSRTERRRHLRKYSEGELPPDRSFFFRGPQGKLKLRAHNLVLFMDLADGVDDETWLFHLQRGEVSAWIRDAIKDEALAAKIAVVERDHAKNATTSRQEIRTLIEAVYTLHATPSKAGSK
jgi:hypothetical protein